MLPLVLSSDSHVFEPPDLWQTRIDRAFRDRAPRIERIDGADQIVVEADQVLSGIGLISNAGARFEAPETISAQGRFEDVQHGGYESRATPRGHGARPSADLSVTMGQLGHPIRRNRELLVVSQTLASAAEAEREQGGGEQRQARRFRHRGDRAGVVGGDAD